MIELDEKKTEAKQPDAEQQKRRKLNSRYTALKTARATWLDSWRNIAEHMRPRAYREFRSDASQGGVTKHSKVINFTPLEAARTLASGMMTGITSPARPWFRLAVAGAPDVSQSPGVKAWLAEVEKVQRELLARSNIYNGLHLVYEDLGPFCVSAMLVEPDAEDGARSYVFPVGTYCLAAGPRGNVDTIFREVSLTVAQLAELFTIEKCSEGVRNMHKAGRLDDLINVCHAIYPNPDFKKGMLGPAGKKWCSDWWELEGSVDAGFLRQSGYSAFPVLAPRWTRVGEDVYGSGPGFDALGDCKALQLYEKRSAQAADKIINPPMNAPTSARNSPISLLPGGTNFIDSLGQGQALRPAVEINPVVIDVFDRKIASCERRIRAAFFANLWLLITEGTTQMTATEVDQRREEKLQQLGAVLEALNDELLDPLLDLLYEINLEAGFIPPPPEELAGRDIKPEYISIMAAAQKLLSTTGLERVASYVVNLSQHDPSALDKLDLDRLVDEYAEALGVPPGVIRATGAVKKLRQARAAAQQQQAQAQQAAQAADTAKTLADTNLEEPSALKSMLRGVNAP